MPQIREPPALLLLCHQQVAKNIVECCSLLNAIATTSNNAQALSIARRNFRPTYINSLPGRVRCQLLEEASQLAARNGGIIINGPAPLYLATLLLANDVRQLKVELCCYYGCSHQAALLKLLATEGQGLESLELARSSLLRLDRSLLQDTLLQATALRRLTLRNIANDTILQVIGVSCPQLVHLDISHSRQVTDNGLKNLLLSVVIRDKDDSTGTTEGLCLSASSGSLVSKQKGWGRLRNFLSIVPWLKPKSKTKDEPFLLECFEQCNKLCEVLQVLNVASTTVTGAGIVLVLNHVPGLKSLGDYYHVGRAFEMMDRALSAKAGEECFQTPTYNLVSVQTQRANEYRLKLLAMACPLVENLTVSEPHHLPKALSYFPDSLTKLHLHSIPSDSKWVSELYEYLATSQGRVLKDLSLRFCTVDFLPRLDLSKIVRFCPNLRNFSQDGADVGWSLDTPKQSTTNVPQMPPPLMPHLVRVQIGRNITAKAVTELLERAPLLEIAHFFSCPDLTDDQLINIATKSCSSHFANREALYNRAAVPTLFKHVECFYMYEAPLLTATAIMALLATCDNLVQIGNFSNFGFDCEGSQFMHGLVNDNNLDLLITTGSHWYCSDCFPML